MGAVGSQRPPHLVELRLEYPQAASSSAFFARIHSEAEGLSKYKKWGEPQALSLWADDVITVTIYTAGSQEDFDRFQCQEFAEVYIPWGIIAGQMADGVEVVFTLGFLKLMPWLGHSAALTKYMDAFHRSYNLAEENPSAPHLQIGIRTAVGRMSPRARPSTSSPASSPMISAEVMGAPVVPVPPPLPPVPRQPQPEPVPVVVPASNLVTSGIRELSSDEMKRLFQLQVRNQELRAQLGLDELGEREVEEQVEDHVSKLREAIKVNYGLRTEQRMVDQELAATSANLTQEQRLIVDDDSAAPAPQPPVSSGSLLDPLEYEQQATTVMAEIQAITRGNIELISEFDEQIKALEAELVEVRQPAPQPTATGNSEGKDELTREQARTNLREASRTLQQQDEALMNLEQEIEQLQKSLQETKAQAEPEPPNPRVRQAEEGILQVKGMIAQDQAATEEQRTSLRQELSEMKERLDIALLAKNEALWEIEELRQVQEGAAVRERERADEHLHREALEKELSRSQCRIGICDEKIERLRTEAADIRERASLVLQAAPDVAGGRSPRAPQTIELEALVRRRQEELHAARGAENKIRKERDEVQQAWEAAKVEAAVLEQKMRLLQGRSAAVRT